MGMKILKLKAYKKLIFFYGIILKNIAKLCLSIVKILGMKIEKVSEETVNGTMSLKIKLINDDGTLADDNWLNKQILTIYTLTIMHRYVVAFKLMDIDEQLLDLQE